MITLHMLSTAVSPITHMHGTAGNVALLQREAILGVDGQVYSVPCLSGNALRHSLVRAPAARHLCEAVGLDAMPYQLADLLWHGGRLTKATPLSAAATKDLLDSVPFLALLGGALPGQILQGCLKVSRGLLVCSEAADLIERRSGVAVQNTHGAETFVGSYLYTRGAEENNPEAIADRMIYEGECVRAGAKFYHTMTLESASPLAVGCLIRALRDASKDIGGMGRIGHGELHIEWACDGIADENALVADYDAFLSASADVIREGLLGLFVEKTDDADDSGGAKKATKKSKKAAKKADDEVKRQAVDALKGADSGLDFFGAVPEE